MAVKSCAARIFQNSLFASKFYPERIIACKSLRRSEIKSLRRFVTQVATEEVRPWLLYSAVCLERYPVITQELTHIENEFKTMNERKEFENSRLSNHEVQRNLDLEREKRRKAGLEDDEETEILLAQDLEDIASEELSKFQPAERITEADKKDDRTSIQRKLSEKLVLLVSSELGGESAWRLPQGAHQEGESMRQTAERVLFSHADGRSIKVKFLGNTPAGFYKYKFPSSVQEEYQALGAKIFFFKAKLLSGSFEKNESAEIDKHAWVTHDELDLYLNKSYLKALGKFLLPL